MMGVRLLVAFVILLVAQPARAQGYLEWQFGMSPDQVSAVDVYAPYTPIGRGDLETYTGRFEGEPVNVSFHFLDTGLEKIQIWLAERASKEDALKRWADANAHIHRLFGDTEALDLGLATVPSQEVLLSTARGKLSETPAEEGLTFRLAPTTMPAGAIVFSSLIRHPEHGYFVFLYYRRALPSGD